MRGARSAPWPSHTRGRLAVASLVVLVVLSGSPAGADLPLPEPKPVLRPRIGSVCGTFRIYGDFNGDGRVDRAVRWFKPRAGRRCDEAEPARSGASLFLGSAGRIERRVPCLSAVALCGASSIDLDRDGRDELAVFVGYGAAFTEEFVFRVEGRRLVYARLPWRGSPRLGIPRGPARLATEVNSGVRQGWGCRTHVGGTRVVIAYLGLPMHRSDGPWDFIRARFRFEDGVLGLLGVRERTEPTPHRFPHTPRTSECGHPGRT